MATPAPGEGHAIFHREIIDLVSTDGDDTEPPTPPRHLPASLHDPLDTPLDTVLGRFDGVFDPDVIQQPNRRRRGEILLFDGEEVFIPDEESEVDAWLNAAVSPDATMGGAARENHPTPDLPQEVATADDCLRRVLDIFPDVSHEHVRELYNGYDRGDGYEALPAAGRLENIIQTLVSSFNYPKQEKVKVCLKRKRQDSVEEDEDVQRWTNPNRFGFSNGTQGIMQAMLKAEFQDISKSYIRTVVKNQKHLFASYVHLAASQYDANGTRIYGKGQPAAQHLADAATIAVNSGFPGLAEELRAARKHQKKINDERTAFLQKKLAEQENLNRAISAGETAECSACFDDLPMNRQIHCNGDEVHFLCFECALTYIKSEVGESRCTVICPAGCGAGFAEQQLNSLSDKPLLEQLAQLRQKKDIRDAGLENLDECPFCDYKAIVPPVEEDFEFRCQNPDCEKTSCRRCKAVSHTPLSCEEHAKARKIDNRHVIEEAMTKALIRACNKCKTQFIKEEGCNKMTCPSCGNIQCYVCSANVYNYEHFDSARSNKLCPLHDNVEQRHRKEIQDAEVAARAKVIEANPDVRAEDLEIKLPESTKQAAVPRMHPYNHLLMRHRDMGRQYQQRQRFIAYQQDAAIQAGDIRRLQALADPRNPMNMVPRAGAYVDHFAGRYHPARVPNELPNAARAAAEQIPAQAAAPPQDQPHWAARAPQVWNNNLGPLPDRTGWHPPLAPPQPDQPGWAPPPPVPIDNVINNNNNNNNNDNGEANLATWDWRIPFGPNNGPEMRNPVRMNHVPDHAFGGDGAADNVPARHRQLAAAVQMNNALPPALRHVDTTGFATAFPQQMQPAQVDWEMRQMRDNIAAQLLHGTATGPVGTLDQEYQRAQRDIDAQLARLR